MEKINKTEIVDYCLEWWDTNSIESIEKDIEKIKKLGATHIEICSCDNGDTIFNVQLERIETDEEFAERMLWYKENKQRVKERDLFNYNKIKEKYNL